MEKLINPVIKVCKHCSKEYRLTWDFNLLEYPNFCQACSMEYGKVVYKCVLCQTYHFHQFNYCSICPGQTIRSFVFPKDGVMNEKSRIRAWDEAGQNNKGKW